MNRHPLLLFALAALALSFFACGGGTPPKEAEKPEHPRHKGAVLTWMELNHRDTLNLGDSATFEYQYVNDGWGELHLTQVDNDGLYCGAEWSRESLRIWDTAQVTLKCRFDHPGFIAQAIHVHYTGEEGDTDHTAALTYYVVVRDSKGNLPEAPAPAKRIGATKQDTAKH